MDVEAECIAHVALCLVGYLEATDTTLHLLAGEEVEDVLYVLYGVDVTVYVHIAIVCADGANQLCIAEAEASVSLNGTDVLLLRNGISHKVAIIEVQEVARTTGLHVYHRPHTACIAHRTALGILDGEVTGGEQFHHTLHPGAHLTMLIVARHLHHLY